MRNGGALGLALTCGVAKELGASLSGHWEIAAADGAFTSVSGGLISSIANRGKGLDTAFVQASGTSQPAHHASGGPNNIPYLELQDANRIMFSAPTSSAGNRTGRYLLAACVDVNGAAQLYRVADASEYAFEIGRDASASQFRCLNKFSSAGQIAHSVSSPSFDTSWHLFAFRPLASGAVWEIDGTPVAGAFGETEDQPEAVDLAIGSPGASGGLIAFVMHVENPIDWRNEIVKQYARDLAGLTIA